MKKLDHNEAVKALREGKVVRAHYESYDSANLKFDDLRLKSDIFNALWGSVTFNYFLNAEYFTLEEQEETHGLDAIKYLMAHDFHNGWELWRLRDLETLVKELDKRYVRK